MNSFPTISYPLAFDSEQTLFQVYNNTQSILTSVIDATTTRIDIIPAKMIEIWPENGFATLPGELLYYDSVEKNNDGKVVALKRCNRAIEGVAKEYAAGTPVYGMVVAQHHNQLVKAIIEIEKTIGELSNTLNQTDVELTDILNKTPIPSDNRFQSSLGATMSFLLGVKAPSDDVCPDVQFEFNVGVPIPGGTKAEYCLRIYPYNAATTAFTIDFGDGSTTTSVLQGVHVFGGGGPYTPSAQISTTNCVLVVQPATLAAGSDVTPSITNVAVPFHIPIPDVPDFPSFISPRRVCPGPLMNLPPIIVPHLTLCSQISMSQISETPSVDICSIMVSIVGCCLPSEISIVGCCPPSFISFVGCCPPSTISITGCCPPSVISITGCCPPSVISITGCCPPSVIKFEGCCPPSVISITGCCPPSVISLLGCNLPSSIKLDCCTLPSIISMSCCDIPKQISVIGCNLPSMISIQCCTLPSVISVNCCNLPSSIKLDCCTLPSIISMSCCDIPKQISVIGCNLPSVISIQCCTLPSTIKLDCCALPSIISVNCCTLPSSIKLDCCALPSIISVACCTFPSVISFGPNPLPSVINFGPSTLPSVISIVCCNLKSISVDCCSLPTSISLTCCSITVPSIGPIQFGTPPSFTPIQFGPVPSFTPIQFGPVPSFTSICFCPVPSFTPICFCPVPSFTPILFGTPPNIIVNWGVPPTVSCIVTITCPASSQVFSMTPPQFGAIPQDFQDGFGKQEPNIPININDIGIPEEIRVIVPKIPDINILHDIPREIALRMPMSIPDIKIIGPDKPLPERIHIIATDVPRSIHLDATDIPRKILVEAATNFPSIIRMEGIPDSLQVTGIPSAIEVIMPSTIQLVMPENPTIELVYRGAPLELGMHPNLEKLLSQIMVQS